MGDTRSERRRARDRLHPHRAVYVRPPRDRRVARRDRRSPDRRRPVSGGVNARARDGRRLVRSSSPPGRRGVADEKLSGSQYGILKYIVCPEWHKCRTSDWDSPTGGTAGWFRRRSRRTAPRSSLGTERRTESSILQAEQVECLETEPRGGSPNGRPERWFPLRIH